MTRGAIALAGFVRPPGHGRAWGWRFVFDSAHHASSNFRRIRHRRCASVLILGGNVDKLISRSPERGAGTGHGPIAKDVIGWRRQRTLLRGWWGLRHGGPGNGFTLCQLDLADSDTRIVDGDGGSEFLVEDHRHKLAWLSAAGYEAGIVPEAQDGAVSGVDRYEFQDVQRLVSVLLPRILSACDGALTEWANPQQLPSELFRLSRFIFRRGAFESWVGVGGVEGVVSDRVRLYVGPNDACWRGCEIYCGISTPLETEIVERRWPVRACILCGAIRTVGSIFGCGAAGCEHAGSESQGDEA